MMPGYWLDRNVDSQTFFQRNVMNLRIGYHDAMVIYRIQYSKLVNITQVTFITICIR